MNRIELIRSTTIYRDYRAAGRGCGEAVRAVHRHWAFIKDLRATNAAFKKRSKAAKKGWKKRRAAAQ